MLNTIKGLSGMTAKKNHEMESPKRRNPREIKKGVTGATYYVISTWKREEFRVDVARTRSTSVSSPALVPISRPGEATFISYREVHTEQVKPGDISAVYYVINITH